jgi:hypothetical protein
MHHMFFVTSKDAFFKAVLQTAKDLRGSSRPPWYLGARLNQILDEHWVGDGPYRDDLAASAFFILRSFSGMTSARRVGLGVNLPPVAGVDRAQSG